MKILNMDRSRCGIVFDLSDHFPTQSGRYTIVQHIRDCRASTTTRPTLYCKVINGTTITRWKIQQATRSACLESRLCARYMIQSFALIIFQIIRESFGILLEIIFLPTSKIAVRNILYQIMHASKHTGDARPN